MTSNKQHNIVREYANRSVAQHNESYNGELNHEKDSLFESAHDILGGGQGDPSTKAGSSRRQHVQGSTERIRKQAPSHLKQDISLATPSVMSVHNNETPQASSLLQYSSQAPTINVNTALKDRYSNLNDNNFGRPKHSLVVTGKQPQARFSADPRKILPNLDITKRVSNLQTLTAKKASARLKMSQRHGTV